MKRLILFCFSMAMAIALGAQRVEAGYLAPFTGNTFPTNMGLTSGVDGHVNFTVLNHVGGVGGDSFGTGLAGFDTHFTPGAGSGALDFAATYLYLFQTVNDGVNTLGITTNSVSVATGALTSHGVFLGTGFTQAGVLTAAGGPWLGVGAAAGNPSPASTAGAAPGVALNGAAFGPLFTTIGSGSLVAFSGPLPAGSLPARSGATLRISLRRGERPVSWTVVLLPMAPCRRLPLSPLVWFLELWARLAWLGTGRRLTRVASNKNEQGSRASRSLGPRDGPKVVPQSQTHGLLCFDHSGPWFFIPSAFISLLTSFSPCLIATVRRRLIGINGVF